MKSYKDGFAFNVNDLESLKGHEICIELTNDMPIFWKHYKYNDLEKSLIQSKTQELWEVGLVELFVREYASTTMMLTKMNIFGNYNEKHMCEDYWCAPKFLVKPKMGLS